jgi:iron complex outermembrane receptor protein/vitamin B12 transporter
MYGPDAMAGVVNITTRQGVTRVPETSFSVEGGNLGTSRGDLSFGGAVRRFDYFSSVSHFDTDNKIPGSGYRNTTYAGRFGGVVNGSIALSGTLRASTGNFGSTNGITIYGIPDDSTETNRYTFGSLAATFAHSERWQSVVRFGLMNRHETFLNPTPTGQPFDPFGSGPNYLGNLMTVTGANGFSVTGQGILDFGGVYPSPFTSNASRESISGQTTYHVSKRVEVSGGLRLDHESGASGTDPSPKGSTRNDYGGFFEVRGTLDRLFATASLGVDHDKSFGTAATPRVSVAYYARKPAAGPTFGGTKLTFNAGTGIKAPSVSQEQSSLFEVAQTVPSLGNKGIEPIGPERTHGFDGGVEQGLWHERVKARVTGFDNQFSDIIEFVDETLLPALGVPPSVASALPGGVFVNSQSYHARGVETSVDLQVSTALRFSASYTFLNAVVTKSLADGSGGGVVPPAFNPAFPDIPIGQFSPLVGARPFRRPAHAGTLAAFYTRGRLGLALAGQFSGKSDDSTFAFDKFFGNTMLLPNKNLNGGYAKIDVTGSYLVHPRIRTFIAFENLLDQNYAPVFGFPALPFTARVGAVITLGGDRR